MKTVKTKIIFVAAALAMVLSSSPLARAEAEASASENNEQTSDILEITPAETAAMAGGASVIAAVGGVLVALFTSSRDKKEKK